MCVSSNPKNSFLDFIEIYRNNPVLFVREVKLVIIQPSLLSNFRGVLAPWRDPLALALGYGLVFGDLILDVEGLHRHFKLGGLVDCDSAVVQLFIGAQCCLRATGGLWAAVLNLLAKTHGWLELR